MEQANEITPRTLRPSSLSHETIGARGHALIRALWRDLALPEGLDHAIELFDILGESWAAHPISLGPPYPSDITDDHSPFEFSLALDESRIELRLLGEALGASPSLGSNWDAAWRLTERLEQRSGVSLTRARAIESLFRPRRPNLRFALWHAVSLNPRGGAPDFKLYFNPQSDPTAPAAGVTQEALRRLGFGRAFDWIARHALGRDGLDHLVYFALDLSDLPEARIKVYVAQERATANEVEAVMAATPGHSAGEARQACLALAGSPGPYLARPPIVSLAFAAGCDARPASATLHVPVRCYAEDDREALGRILPFLPSGAGPLYARLLASLTPRRLEDGVGLQTYASLRRHGGSRRVTVYLSPELHAVSPPRRA